MAFGKTKDGAIKRPSRVLRVLLWILVIPFCAVLAITATVARPYFAMVNGIMAPNLSIEENRAEPRAITQEVESEAIVLLENDGVLPLGSGARVNVFGVGIDHNISMASIKAILCAINRGKKLEKQLENGQK